MTLRQKTIITLFTALTLLITPQALAWCAGYDYNSCQAEAETKLRDDLGDMYYWCYSYGPGLTMWDQATCDEAYRLYNNSIIDCKNCYQDPEPCAWWDWFCDWEWNWLW